MKTLTDCSCEACRVGAPALTEDEAAELLPLIPQWQVVDRQGVSRLERTFKFKDFAQALAFTDTVGELAEANGHHPKIITAWGSVKVIWWTHKIRGLHKNDFIMASKTDLLHEN